MFRLISIRHVHFFTGAHLLIVDRFMGTFLLLSGPKGAEIQVLLQSDSSSVIEEWKDDLLAVCRREQVSLDIMVDT